jgi:small subunit ribosomal protein S19
MIYNGKVHIPLTVTSEMVGHKFGEYVFTRKKVKHNFDKRRTQGGFKKKQK